jgi:glycine cleavage system H protein
MEAGAVVVGVERELLHEIGEIQTIVLPVAGDKLRQGTEFVKILSSDMRNFTVDSPLSGVVAQVNKEVLESPDLLLRDPYGNGWLIRLTPSNLEKELELLGL